MGRSPLATSMLSVLPSCGHLMVAQDMTWTRRSCGVPMPKVSCFPVFSEPGLNDLVSVFCKVQEN